MNVWDSLPKQFFVLAPMEDVTDTVFRRVVARAAKPDLFMSEFTHASGWVHAGDKATAGRLVIADETTEQPVLAQIWGTVPGDIAAIAAHCKILGFVGIDINMGCPVKHAIKSGGGAAMIKNPNLAAKIITAAKTAGLPVSVKTRLGYETVDQWREWLSFLLKQDISALTVHLRSKKELSKVAAHWELMPKIKQLRDELSPHTKLIGNGDVKDRAHGEVLISDTGIDGVMIGRGIFTNPFCFEKNPKQHTKTELLELLKYHLDLWQDKWQGKKPYDPLKRFFKIYVRDFSGAHELRNQLMLSKNVAEAQQTILQFQKTDYNTNNTR